MPVPIVAAVRSPFAEADGVLAGWHPVDLAAEVMNAALEQAGIAPEDVDHVWVGCDEPVGAQGANVARAMVLTAGWPDSIAGTVVEAAPHSGFSALAAAVDAVSSGRVENAIVVGVSSASQVQPGASALGRLYGRPWGDGPNARYDAEGGLVPSVVAADRAAGAAGIDGAAQDAWGLASIERRGVAPASALVTVGARPGDAVAVQRDSPIDADVIRAVPIDDLVPIFDDDGTTTAASYAPAADGVSVLVLGRGNTIADILEVNAAGGSPFDLAGPVRAFDPRRVQIDVLDLAVSSASMALVALTALGVDANVDRHGGTIAVGDAGAAEDLRLVVDAIHRAPEDAVGQALRVAPGAAAGCLWHRP